MPKNGKPWRGATTKKNWGLRTLQLLETEGHSTRRNRRRRVRTKELTRKEMPIEQGETLPKEMVCLRDDLVVFLGGWNYLFEVFPGCEVILGWGGFFGNHRVTKTSP